MLLVALVVCAMGGCAKRGTAAPPPGANNEHALRDGPERGADASDGGLDMDWAKKRMRQEDERFGQGARRDAFINRSRSRHTGGLR